LGYLFVVADPRPVIWTAHLTSTAREAFLDLDSRIAGVPGLSRRVKAVRRVNGEQEIEMKSGARLLFRARSGSGSARGLTIKALLLDEAYALTPELLGAMLPTISTVADAQVVYASSAGRVESSVLRRVRDRGRKGGDPSLAYLEWCAPERDCVNADCSHEAGVPGCVLDDEALWHVANPALGGRIAVDSLRAERRSLPPAEFMRERLGWWDEAGEKDNPPLDAQVWESTVTDEMPSQVRIAIAAGYDLGSVSVAVSGRLNDGRLFVGLVRRGVKSDWVPDYVAGLAAKYNSPVIVDPGNPAGALIAALTVAGVKVEHPSRGEFARSCVAFADDVNLGRVWHSRVPQLDGLIGLATRKALGSLWVWRRGGPLGLDVSPLEAVTLAHAANASQLNVEVLSTIY